MPIYNPISLPSASAAALSRLVIDRFLGADLTNAPANVDLSRSPDCENMIRDVPGKVRKRMGWRTVLTLVLTQLNFAYNIGYLGGGENINDLGMMVILARNIAAIGVTCLAVAGMYRCVRPAEPSPDEACHARRTVIARRAR